MTSSSTEAQHGLCVTVVMVRSRLLLSVDGDIENKRYPLYCLNDTYNTSDQSIKQRDDLFCLYYIHLFMKNLEKVKLEFRR